MANVKSPFPKEPYIFTKEICPFPKELYSFSNKLCLLSKRALSMIQVPLPSSEKEPIYILKRSLFILEGR